MLTRSLLRVVLQEIAEDKEEEIPPFGAPTCSPREIPTLSLVHLSG
jgi:hypothetical protein